MEAGAVRRPPYTFAIAASKGSYSIRPADRITTSGSTARPTDNRRVALAGGAYAWSGALAVTDPVEGPPVRKTYKLLTMPGRYSVAVRPVAMVVRIVKPKGPKWR